MKKILFTLALIVAAIKLQAQVNDIFDFNGTNGYGPSNGLSYFGQVGNNLFGTVGLNNFIGGYNDYVMSTGNVCMINTTNGQVSTKGTIQGYPIGSIVPSGSVLYEATQMTTDIGTLISFGHIYKINSDGTGLTSIYTFAIGENPNGAIVVSGTTIYGIATGGSGTHFFKDQYRWKQLHNILQFSFWFLWVLGFES